MIQALRDDVFVIPMEDPDLTPGGLWVPPKAKQRVDQGIVKYVGPEVKEIRRGDHVLFGGYTGQKLSVEDEGILYVMRERDIVCVFPDSTDRLVTQTEILSFLEQTNGRLLTESYGFDPEVVTKAIEILRSEIKDYFYAEGLEF